MFEISETFKYAKLEKQGNGYIYDPVTNVTSIQDCYGKSSIEQIKTYFYTLDREHRRIFTAIIAQTQSYDTLIEFLRMTIISRLREKCVAESEEFFNQRLDKMNKEEKMRIDRIEKKEKIFTECKKPIFKRIAWMRQHIKNLEFSNGVLKNQINGLNRSLNETHKELQSLRDRFVKLTTVERLIKLIKES